MSDDILDRKQRAADREPRADKSARWIDHFFQAIILDYYSARVGLRCAQLFPEDSTEAARLIELGHFCDLFQPETGNIEFTRIHAPERSYDIVITGNFLKMAITLNDRASLAREINRVLKDDGIFLGVFGNAACPIDLTRTAGLVHRRRHPSLLTSQELEKEFRSAGFKTIDLRSVRNHFGWVTVPLILRPLGIVLDLLWSTLLHPRFPLVYRSGLNPTLILIAKKGH
jgi:hypothetical protein